VACSLPVLLYGTQHTHYNINAMRNTAHRCRQHSVRGAPGLSKRRPLLPQQGLQHVTSLPEQNKMASQCGGNTISCNFVCNCNAKLNTYLFAYVKNVYIYTYTYKGKAVPLQAWIGLEGSRKLRFPYFVTTAQDGGRLSVLRTGRLYPPRKYSWYSFLLEAESTPGP